MAQDKLTAQLARLKAQEAENTARETAAAERLKKLRDERKELGAEIAALERKVRNHRLIETGALVEKILGESVDKGILAGLLDKYKGLFDGSGAAVEIKIAGDSLISRWEAEKEAAKAARKRRAAEPEMSDDDGND